MISIPEHVYWKLRAESAELQAYKADIALAEATKRVIKLENQIYTLEQNKEPQCPQK